MVAAHLGLAVTIVGIAFSQNYSVERDVRMKSGDSVDIHEYSFTFSDVKEVTGPNSVFYPHFRTNETPPHPLSRFPLAKKKSPN
ncbi:heme lyase subunit CcmF [Escherichia coli]|nr:heme lyase subunit CcmF [Escherichia coli]